ncbi:MAG: heme exporter protein CcmD [Aquimonas sp.]|nr:heme exporter protein CcmD [Aquimonas sp.]
MSALFDMGPYSAHVWTCFGLFVAVLVWDFLLPLRRTRRLRRELAAQTRREVARSQAATTDASRSTPA